MRKQHGPPPEVTPQVDNNIITQVREYELITPLFGGGVKSGEADPVTVIRGTEIRGQLRFWWRATRGGQFNGNLGAMKDSEDKIWGTTYKKDGILLAHNETIQIVVESNSQNSFIQPYIIYTDKKNKKQSKPDPTSVVPAYAAFPLQPSETDLKQQESIPKKVSSGITFKLTITFPMHLHIDIEAAVWAWETFGGIGARTRRGFGALHLISVDGKKVVEVDKDNVRNWIQEHITNFVATGTFPQGLPHLSQHTQFQVIPSRNNASAISVWQFLIDRLKSFRQARTQGTSGRTLWPEPEAIRELTNRRGSNKKFPRAAFGLPIIFHFKDAFDPKDSTLRGKDSERLASPLLLRPFVCKGNQAVGLAVLLDGTHQLPDQLVLREKNGTDHAVSEILNKDEAQSISILQGETDILKAFMKHVQGVNR